MAIEFKQVTEEYKGLIRYILTLDKEYTVEEFIKTIMITRMYDKGIFYINDEPGVIKYAYGHLRHGFKIPDEFKSLKVKSVEAEVSWSQIDYYIETGDADERES